MPIPSNPLASLAAMPGLVENALRSFPAPHLHWEPESWGGIPGERFSFAGQICHLRDLILSSHDYQHLACLDWLAGKLHAGIEGG